MQNLTLYIGYLLLNEWHWSLGKNWNFKNLDKIGNFMLEILKIGTKLEILRFGTKLEILWIGTKFEILRTKTKLEPNLKF